MTVNTFYFDHKNKAGLINVIDRLETDILWRIRIDEYNKKTRIQEEKYHAMLGDIARQCTHLNENFSLDDWKRLLVDMFARECVKHIDQMQKIGNYFLRNSVRLVPSIDGSGLVALGSQTRDFPRYVAAGFIEYLYSFGAEHDVRWSEPGFYKPELAENMVD